MLKQACRHSKSVLVMHRLCDHNSPYTIMWQVLQNAPSASPLPEGTDNVAPAHESQAQCNAATADLFYQQLPAQAVTTAELTACTAGALGDSHKELDSGMAVKVQAILQDPSFEAYVERVEGQWHALIAGRLVSAPESDAALVQAALAASAMQ